ncbi:MAG: DUF3488 and transglutaminase-like domain-containing protein, partial [Gammaproteobacteria bacterium]|nr:DUF3488 and transglutaminase-like domain-containing protein [Gammaproteobacteria bacterium]
LCCLMIFWRFLYEFYRFPLPGRFIRTLILILALFALYSNYSTLIGQSAGSALLVLMLTMKLLELDKHRDVVVILYISFFVIVTGFLFEQGIIMATYMLFAVWMLLTTMVIWNQQANKNQIPPDYKLHHFRLSFILLFQSLPLMFLLFFLFPRLPGPLWSIPEESGRSTGLSDTLEPGSMSQLSNNPDIAFRVKFDGPIPISSKLYWRGPVLSLYDGVKWHAAEINLHTTKREDTTVSEPVDYTITLQPHNQRWLFALEAPSDIPAQSNISNDLQLISNNLITSITQYKIRSYLNYYYDTQFLQNPKLTLAIPENTSPKTRIFIHNLQQQYSSQKDLVRAVLNHFRDQAFYYTRKPPKLYGDITDEFLFETRRGYCVHYASAFAVMMRMANIPARIISGYQGGEENTLSDYLIVRQSDAHAWVEIWLAGDGWLRIDPTSVIPPQRIENAEDILRHQENSFQKQFRLSQGGLTRSLHQFRLAIDAVNYHWNSWVIGYDHNKQQSIFTSLGLDKLSLSKYVLYMTAIVLLLIFTVSLFVFKKKRQKITAITALYNQFCKKLAHCGFEKLPQESATDFANRVISQRNDLAAEIIPITRLYNLLRYASTKDAPELAGFRNKIKVFRPKMNS